MAYAFIVAIVSLLGAAVPLRTRPGHAGLQVYLSLAAGALLGAAMFHLLPHAAEHTNGHFGIAATAGVLFVFLMQRYIAPHSHEAPALPSGDPHNHDCGHDHDHGHNHANGHAHDHAHSEGPQQTAAPLLRGSMAIIALSVHSLFDGVAIGAVTSSVETGENALLWSVFGSVLIHKPLDGLSVSVLLMNTGTRRGRLWLVQIFYAALVPIGAALFHLTQGAVADAGPWLGQVLAFSAGTFLAIALTDLLPELQFHRHDRNKLTFFMLLGIAIMWFTSWLEPSDHAGHSHAPSKSPTSATAPAEAPDDHSGHDH